MSEFWFQTYSGVRFDYVEPRPDMVRIEDIAHALSLLCRFNGAVKQFYSVAQHCVLASQFVVPDKDYMPALLWQRRRLRALLHDATEAYVGDCVRPLKHMMRDRCDRAGIASPYDTAERSAWTAIRIRFGLDSARDAAVDEIDQRLLATERRDLMGPVPYGWASLGEAQGGSGVRPLDATIVPWDARRAELAYLERFEDLTHP